MKAISIKLPDALFHDLAACAQAHSATQSDIIRLSLAVCLKRDARAPSASCAERARRWAGMVKGPAELSTNPEHMRGFGE